MLTHRIVPVGIAAVFLATLSSPAASQSLFSLRFLDDFTKPRQCERDPYAERMETERHDFTQSTKTVGRGIKQIEAGYSYFYKDENEEIEHTHVTPEMLLRMGLTEDIEFRLRFNYAWQFIDVEDDVDGAQDLIWSDMARSFPA